MKRQIIGNTFIHVKDDVMEELKLDAEHYFLAQGMRSYERQQIRWSVSIGTTTTFATHLKL